MPASPESVRRKGVGQSKELIEEVEELRDILAWLVVEEDVVEEEEKAAASAAIFG